ncbi:MAG TPA: hypothetical protein VFY79_10275 [Dehalococcoidia bacterium]|nr:hypothetical protein [Dehalococcoidia bacterium]
MPVSDHQRLQRDAREPLGERLTSEQEEAVARLVSGHDMLVVMRQRARKSAIYRLAARELTGPTVVVSPLITPRPDQAIGIEGQDVGESRW